MLVVQPTFIFGAKYDFNNFTEKQEDRKSVLMTKPKYEMAFGTVISLICALSAGLINVSAAKTKGISRVSLMISGGIGTYLVTFIGYLSMPNSESSTRIHLYERAFLTMAVATGSMIAGQLLLIANQVIPYYIYIRVRVYNFLKTIMNFHLPQCYIWAEFFSAKKKIFQIFCLVVFSTNSLQEKKNEKF